MLTKALRAVIIGAPGSGKGTISTRIVKHFDFIHVSSGDLLRTHGAEKTEIGKEAQKFMDAGQLVPDELVEKLIMHELKLHKDKDCLLDGYPRTTHQAKLLNKLSPVDIAIDLLVPPEIIISRIAGRWIHLASGRVYNTEFNPPKIAFKDDETGEDLIQRADDMPNAVKKRLEIYYETIEPVLKYYNDQGILKVFKGTETNKIWPNVYEYLKTFKNPLM